jgi:hypothetical protein
VAGVSGQARRVAWAAEGLARGFIDLAAFNDYIVIADAMGERGPRWWMPRYDQPWRYSKVWPA